MWIENQREFQRFKKLYVNPVFEHSFFFLQRRVCVDFIRFVEMQTVPNLRERDRDILTWSRKRQLPV